LWHNNSGAKAMAPLASGLTVPEPSVGWLLALVLCVTGSFRPWLRESPSTVSSGCFQPLQVG
jgi:hypothetical protein